MFNRLRIYLLVLVFSMTAGLAMAKELVIERAIFEDASGLLNLEQVKNAPFSSAKEVVFKGFSRSTFWLRLTVEAADQTRNVSLQIRPNLLDTVSLYYQNDVQPHVDLMLEMNSREAQNETLVTLASGKQHLYLKLNSIGAMLVWAQVLSLEAATERSLKDQMKFGGVSALYGMLFFVMLILLFEYRRRLVLLFIVHLSFCFVFYLLFFDLRAIIIPWEWTQSKSAARLSTIFVFFSFSYLLQEVFKQVNLHHIQRWAQHITRIFLLIVILFIAGEQYWAMRIFAASGTFITLLLLAVLCKIVLDFVQFKEIKLVLRVLFGLFAFTFIGITSTVMLELLGVLNPTVFIIESPALRAVFLPVFLIGCLWQNELINKKEIEKTKNDKLVIEIREKEKNERLFTQSQFMAMLMHELKTPLYIIQLAISSIGRSISSSSPDTKRLNNIHRALDDINFILDKCLQADQLDQNDLPLHKSVLSLKTLLTELKHLDKAERIIYSGLIDASIYSDYQYARIIVSNLATNALKYAKSESNVLISVQSVEVGQERKIQIRFSNMVGRAGRPNLEKVFTRYYREESTKNVVGAGLGLWLANSLAVKLGAELQCQSQDDWVHFDFLLEQQ
jgi:signal transduction histidine kinase